MKKYFRIAMIILGVVLFLTGCKKDNNSSNNSAASINDKNWWGMFTYAGDSSEYYSAHFNTDKSITWNQSLGEYKGTWSLSGNHLTMDFGPGSIVVTADLTGDNKMTNIKTNNTSVVNNGQLMTSTSEQSLDGSTWKGTFYDKIGSTYPITMVFSAGSKVDIGFDGLTPVSYTYTRSASGVTIRTAGGDDEVWFGLIMSDTKMQGTDRPENKWNVTKQ
jgi:hypothetical protein